MNVSELQRKLLVALVASLVAAALMAIVILFAGEFGEMTGKILLTTLALAGFSLTGMAATVPQRGGRPGAVAPLGLGSSATGFVLAEFIIWFVDAFDGGNEALAKLFGLTIVASITFAHAALLGRLLGRGATGDAVITGTLVASSVLAMLTSGLILFEWEARGLWRVLGALGVLVVLGTLLTPLVPRITGAAAPVEEQSETDDQRGAASKSRAPLLWISVVVVALVAGGVIAVTQDDNGSGPGGCVPPIDGIDGISGIDGVDGIDGIGGIDGFGGRPGQPGSSGTDGTGGTDGTDGTPADLGTCPGVRCTEPTAGTRGTRGTDGKRGSPPAGSKGGTGGKGGEGGVGGKGGRGGVCTLPA